MSIAHCNTMLTWDSSQQVEKMADIITTEYDDDSGNDFIQCEVSANID